MTLRAVDAIPGHWALVSLDYESIHAFLVMGHHNSGNMMMMMEYGHMILRHIYLSLREVRGYKRSVTVAGEGVDAGARRACVRQTWLLKPCRIGRYKPLLLHCVKCCLKNCQRFFRLPASLRCLRSGYCTSACSKRLHSAKAAR